MRLDTPIEYLKGVGPQRAAMLQKELQIFTVGDLVRYFPFRHEDRTIIHPINSLHEDMPLAQVRGFIIRKEIVGTGNAKRLVAHIKDSTGVLELVWFKGIPYIQKQLHEGVEYVVYGKPNVFRSSFNLVHPEIEVYTSEKRQSGFLQPVYSTTETLKNRGLNSKAISKLIQTSLPEALGELYENLPPDLIHELNLPYRAEAIQCIHVPEDENQLKKSIFRLKLEEALILQLRLIHSLKKRKRDQAGLVLDKKEMVSKYFSNYLPFPLTEAQKKVIKEIYTDLSSGKQMNRLLQGDVGSGKTIVAFISALFAIDSGAQTVIMAPTEILAKQHFLNLQTYFFNLSIPFELLTGSTTASKKREILQRLESGELMCVVGTHALIEDNVIFKNLGLCIIDEQHRFGVAQRAKLWTKNKKLPPHVLVMTATPIPRTLAMTIYGELDVSVINELPMGRKPITTAHRYIEQRPKVYDFIEEQIKLGRQVYIVHPLIEENEKLELEDLENGYERVCKRFPQYKVGKIHGKMRPSEKDEVMEKFVSGETHILVATTVIEVGVNVPNASIMLIENAERFGLSQLHQLRGRVGRGSEQSYCILLTDFKLSANTRVRLETMTRTNDGFEIANVDLTLRGAGDLLGTKQSGMLEFKLLDLTKDGEIIQLAREKAKEILEKDYELELPEHQNTRRFLIETKKTNWSKVS